MACILAVAILTAMKTKALSLNGARRLKLMTHESDQALKFRYAETIAGVSHIRALRWRRYMEWNAPYIDASQKTFFLERSVVTWRESVLGLLSTFFAFGLVLISLFTTITPAGCAFICFNHLNLDLLTTMWLRNIINLDEGLIALQQLRDFIETAPQETPEVNMITPPENWPCKGVVQLQDVSIWFK